MSTTTTTASPHPQHLHNLLQTVHTHLQHQADWHSLTIHTSPALPRPLICGIPPEGGRGAKKMWVLPASLREKWSLRKWAEVFDALPGVEGDGEGQGGGEGEEEGKEGKKLMMGIVSDDSTVVYYVVGEGIVKPKQN
ncbi:hypothetical protein L873DRAFT_1701117 [Choiromyces venosus 120613-1]|uniref:tRNA-splicing endonuclease subunit Sen15 domain-containing protein n=1 Tax=Choiromyces venosus 120613-1 TaxID=1336337 RepID=A0A3N4JDK0_9PEZI|nr:hypothetical protein L873DRAFT_1701117 [Choiromyces venosus 120613-1]